MLRGATVLFLFYLCTVSRVGCLTDDQRRNKNTIKRLSLGRVLLADSIKSAATIHFSYMFPPSTYSQLNQNSFGRKKRKQRNIRRMEKSSFFIPNKTYSSSRLQKDMNEVFMKDRALFLSIGTEQENESNKKGTEEEECSKRVMEISSPSETDLEEVEGNQKEIKRKEIKKEVSLNFETLEEETETMQDRLLNTLPNTEEEFTDEHENILREIGWEIIESREDNPEIWDEAMKWLELRNGTYIPLCDPSPVVRIEDVVPLLIEKNDGAKAVQNYHESKNENIELRNKSYENELSDSDVQVYMEDISVQRLTIRTNNIERSISFYSLLGFFPIAKYTVNFQRAAWLRLVASANEKNHEKKALGNEQKKHNDRISSNFVLELIQVPDPPLAHSKVLNLIDEKNKNVIGINRFCIDVTDIIRNRIDLFPRGLSDWLEAVNKQSQEKFGKKIKILEEPFQQMIYRQIIETCYISDDSGVVLEIMNRLRLMKDEEMIMDW